MKKIFLFTVMLTLSLAFVLTAGCGRRGDQKKTRILPVEGVKVKRGDLSVQLYYVGDIKAQDQVIVYPKVTGKLLENTVKEGQVVKKRDVIAYIDRDEIGFEFKKAPVESPLDGIVGRVYLDKGESVSPGTAVAQIVDMDAVEVEIDIIERDLPKIKEGQWAKIRVDAYPGEVFEGVVEMVSPVIDPASRTADIEIRIPNNDHRLNPGMFARVDILVGEKKGVLVIPRDAILKVNSSRYVFVVEDNVAYRRRIETGIHENNDFEVAEGLREGEIVVTLGNTLLRDGDKVKIMIAEQEGMRL